MGAIIQMVGPEVAVTGDMWSGSECVLKAVSTGSAGGRNVGPEEEESRGTTRVLAPGRKELHLLIREQAGGG